MNRITLLIALICTTLLSDAQTIGQRYIVKLTDKNGTPFSINNPQDFLTARAINRRAAQGIAINQSDLPVNPSYVQQIAAINGVTVVGHSKWLNTVTVDLTSASLLTNINALPFVQSSANVGRIPGNINLPVDDKFYNEKEGPVNQFQSFLRTASFNYGNSLNQVQMININALHDLGYTGQNMLIAVLDAGFNSANFTICFDSLYAQNRVLATWDFVSEESNVYDNSSHGTSVLSTMAAIIPGDIIGTAPAAQYILLRSEDENTEYIIEEYNWAEAAEYADSAGADVINSSLGYTEFDDPAQNHTYGDMNGDVAPGTLAADMAAAKGILVVNSAGNSGNNPWQYIGVPADGDSVLAIGAVDASGFYASFSSQGPAPDGRIKPNVVAQGQGSTVFTPFASSSNQSSGTSFSSPIIAGAVACLWQRYPNKTNMEILHAVEESASQFNNPDGYLGYGIPDFALASIALGGKEISGLTDEIETIDFYPNPLKSGSAFQLSYYLRDSQNLVVEVFDVAGKMIEQQTLGNIRSVIDVDLNTHLANGIYIVNARTEDYTIKQKLLVY